MSRERNTEGESEEINQKATNEKKLTNRRV